MNCPACSSIDVKPSRPRWSDSPRERLSSRLPYRCYECFNRFYAAPDGTVQAAARPAPPPRGASRKARQKALRRGMIGIGFFIALFLVFIYLLMNMAPPE